MQLFPHHSPPRSAGGPLRLAGLSALALLAACEVPSIPDAAPIVDLRWVVPSQTTRITVANLLPTGVTIAPDSSGFLISAPAATVTRTLGQDCTTCVAGQGLNIPKPAFTANATTTTTIPTDVGSATLVGGSLNIVVTNNYTFDPLRSSTPPGYAIITVSNGTTVIGKDSVNGATTALPPNGGTLTRSIPLLGAVSGSQPVTVALSLTSPAGSTVTMDATKTISVTATPTNLKVASANVNVVSKSVTQSSTIDLASIDNTIIEHVESGSLLLTIANPFNVTGTLTVRLTPSGGAVITRSIPLAAGASTATVSFNKAEIQTLLGRTVNVTYSGAVNASGGPVNVTPKQAVVVTSRLDLTLKVGG